MELIGNTWRDADTFRSSGTCREVKWPMALILKDSVPSGEFSQWGGGGVRGRTGECSGDRLSSCTASVPAGERSLRWLWPVWFRHRAAGWGGEGRCGTTAGAPHCHGCAEPDGRSWSAPETLREQRPERLRSSQKGDSADAELQIYKAKQNLSELNIIL